MPNAITSSSDILICLYTFNLSITEISLAVPSRPEELKITDAKKDSVGLKWKSPKSDGGSAIVEYLVEKRQVGKEEYLPATEEKVTDTYYVVQGFKEGDHFEFRVSARNDVGVGPPSFPTKPVICREIQGI